MEKVVVFTDTNIDTHFAIPVSPHITASDFMRELKRTHLTLFPALGEIEAHEVMVRRKGCFYHLTESLPLNYAFQGSKGRWFLHVRVQPLNCLNKLVVSPCLVEKDGSYITDSFAGHVEEPNNIEEISETVPNFDRKGMKKSDLENREDEIKEFPNLNEETTGEPIVSRLCRVIKPVVGSSIPVVKTPEKRETKSISAKRTIGLEGNSILTRSHDSQSPVITSIASENQLKGKRETNCSNEQVQVHPVPEFDVRTPPRRTPLPYKRSSGNNLQKTARVGRRIMNATHKLTGSQNKQKSVLSVYRRLSVSRSVPSVARLSVFEISDNDD